VFSASLGIWLTRGPRRVCGERDRLLDRARSRPCVHVEAQVAVGQHLLEQRSPVPVQVVGPPDQRAWRFDVTIAVSSV
jgi:hypothetical protein